MGIGHRPERGVAYRREVQIERRILGELMYIVKSQGHDEIVRVLRIH
jgi:hypothetical protein